MTESYMLHTMKKPYNTTHSYTHLEQLDGKATVLSPQPQDWDGLFINNQSKTYKN